MKPAALLAHALFAMAAVILIGALTGVDRLLSVPMIAHRLPTIVHALDAVVVLSLVLGGALACWLLLVGAIRLVPWVRSQRILVRCGMRDGADKATPMNRLIPLAAIVLMAAVGISTVYMIDQRSDLLALKKQVHDQRARVDELEYNAECDQLARDRAAGRPTNPLYELTCPRDRY
jgi:hypothetical protein